MKSLREALINLGIDRTHSFSYRGSLPYIRPKRLSALICACEDPQLSQWVTIGDPGKANNMDFSKEAQGIASDGYHWFLSCNANDKRDGLYKLTFDMKQVGSKLDCPIGHDVHIGALCVSNSWVYVATQEPFGIWKVSTDFQQSFWLPDNNPPEVDIFPWCDINPENDYLYTSSSTRPKTLWAYDASALQGGELRRVDANIGIVQPEIDEAKIEQEAYANCKNMLWAIDDCYSAEHPDPERAHALEKAYEIEVRKEIENAKDKVLTTRCQGACFTPNFRILILCDVDGAERIHCHSTITGAFMGIREFQANQNEGEVRNELEGITLLNMTKNDIPVQVHVLELNNEIMTSDDFYLWHFHVPKPDIL